jgi:hypothetical protein
LLALFSGLFLTLPLSAQLIAGEKLAPANRLKDFNGKTFMVKPTGKTIAYIFLSTECPLSTNYAPVLKAIQQKHPDIWFYGILSGALSS